VSPRSSRARIKERRPSPAGIIGFLCTPSRREAPYVYKKTHRMREDRGRRQGGYRCTQSIVSLRREPGTRMFIQHPKM
jgi:hypothetical protein